MIHTSSLNNNTISDIGCTYMQDTSISISYTPVTHIPDNTVIQIFHSDKSIPDQVGNDLSSSVTTLRQAATEMAKSDTSDSIDVPTPEDGLKVIANHSPVTTERKMNVDELVISIADDMVIEDPDIVIEDADTPKPVLDKKYDTGTLCFVYCRASHLNQVFKIGTEEYAGLTVAGWNLCKQKKKCEEYAKEHSWIPQTLPISTFYGEIQSGKHIFHTKTKCIRQMLLDTIEELCRNSNKSFKRRILLVSSYDRLSRNVDDAKGLYAFLRDHDVTIASVREDSDTSTQEGVDVYLKAISKAQKDNEYKDKRAREGRELKKQQGLHHAGRVPFGYMINNDKLVPKLDEQKILSKIIKLKNLKWTYSDIANKLNKLKCKSSSGKKWTRDMVKSILIGIKTRKPAIQTVESDPNIINITGQDTTVNSDIAVTNIKDNKASIETCQVSTEDKTLKQLADDDISHIERSYIVCKALNNGIDESVIASYISYELIDSYKQIMYLRPELKTLIKEIEEFGCTSDMSETTGDTLGKSRVGITDIETLCKIANSKNQVYTFCKLFKGKYSHETIEGLVLKTSEASKVKTLLSYLEIGDDIKVTLKNYLSIIKKSRVREEHADSAFKVIKALSKEYSDYYYVTDFPHDYSKISELEDVIIFRGTSQKVRESCQEYLSVIKKKHSKSELAKFSRKLIQLFAEEYIDFYLVNLVPRQK